MSFSLFGYQGHLYTQCFAHWQDPAVRNIMLVLATGGGKTVVFCKIAADFGMPVCAIAHRNELVSQMALAFNQMGIPHGIIAQDDVVSDIVKLEMEWHGESFYQPRAAIRVAGVDTLRSRDTNDRWFKQVGLVIQDEGHHVLTRNKWGKAMALFPNARGLFVTAHACRADGLGLGRSADGFVDALIVGPCARDLIGQGYLTDYRLLCPPDDVDLEGVAVGDTGDYVQAQLRDRVHASRTLVGSVVEHYLTFAPGKLGITFAVDTIEAAKIEAGYRAAGVPVATITGKTPITTRGQLMRRFRNRDILQLISVDVLGEGVDVPAIEVVSMARHTASWQLMCQQFGRGLRVMVADAHKKQWHTYTDAQRLELIAQSQKPKAIMLDHVGNIARHYVHRGLPDSKQSYTLARLERKSRKAATDAIPLVTCMRKEPFICLRTYERDLDKCPHCNFVRPAPAGRTTPEQVDGNLFELDPAILAQLRGEIARIDSPPETWGNDVVARSIQKNHKLRQDAQAALRAQMALWAGYHRHLKYSDEECYRRFFFQFGIDAATAQTLGATDAILLQCRIFDFLLSNNVRAA